MGRLYTASASFTRPSNTTAYAAGDLVANSATAGSVAPMTLSWPNGQNFSLRNVTLKKTKVDLTNASFNVWFFGGASAPTVTNGDNGAFAGDFLSSILFEPVRVDFAATATGSGVIGTSLFGEELLTLPPTCYALIEALAAYTPASAEVFTLALQGTSL